MGRLFKTTIPVGVYRLTRGRLLGRMAGMPVLLLQTCGRRTGRVRTTPVQYLRDGEDVVVVAANGGAPQDPAWLLNLRADPHARVQLGAQVRDVVAHEAGPEERARLWPRLTAAGAALERVARKAGRELPIVVLAARP